jgi:DNA-binding transcriptional MerR regulator
MAGRKVDTQLYYKIGEACKLLDIQPYVLRYWETEFAALSPSKSRSGQRVYSEKELAIIGRIKQLLYEEGFTIAGAKKKLEGELSAGGPMPSVRKEAAPIVPVATPKAKVEREVEIEPGLDTSTDDRLELLRRGLADALLEARELLAVLDRLPTSRPASG